MINQKPTVAFRLDVELIEAIEDIADERGISKSELVREILQDYIEKQ